MRVLFIHQNFPGQFKHLAPALAAQGHEVLALGVNQPKHATPGVRVILHRPQVPAAAKTVSTAELRELQAKIARGHSVAMTLQALKRQGFHPDVIYAHSGWGEALFIKDVFPSVPLLIYAEYFYGTEGGDANFDKEFTRWTLESAERLKIKNTHLLNALLDSDHALSPTTFQRDRHPQLFQNHISVIHDGIETGRFKPDAKSSVSLRRAGVTLHASDEVVTFVARELEPYRGYHMFMRALPQMMALRPKARFVVVGGDGVSYGAAPPDGKTWKDIFLQEVTGQIDASRLHFVGPVPHETLTQLMQVSTVHLYLTYPFVLSWSLLEAMSVGCLIVGSRTGPVEEVIKHQQNGLLVDFFNPSEIANTVAEAVERRNDLQDLRAAARALAVEKYDLLTHCLPAQIALVKDMALKAKN
jgi:glycosyltransferase involved in cell wall biosynthesis